MTPKKIFNPGQPEANSKSIGNFNSNKSGQFPIYSDPFGLKTWTDSDWSDLFGLRVRIDFKWASD